MAIIKSNKWTSPRPTPPTKKNNMSIYYEIFFSLEKLKPGLYASSDLTLLINTQAFLLSKNNSPLQTKQVCLYCF